MEISTKSPPVGEGGRLPVLDDGSIFFASTPGATISENRF